MMAPNNKIQFSLFNNRFDTTVQKVYDLDWYTFVELITAPHTITNDKDSTLFGPWEFTPNGTRCADDVIAASMICLDFDHGVSLDQAKIKFAGLEHVLYTSYSHKKDGESDDRFRVVLPLAHPVTPEALIERRKAIYAWAKGVDISSLSISRCFYLPACPQERSQFAVSYHSDGELLDVLAFEKEPPYVPPADTPETTDEDKVWLLEKLPTIYIGNEPEWFKVASCMCANGFSLNDFCNVTLNGLMQQKTVKDCETKWKAVSKTRRDFPIGYLFKLLKLHGITRTRPNPVKELYEIKKEIARRGEVK